MRSSRKIFVSGGTGDIGRRVVTRLAASGHTVHFQFHLAESLAKQLAQDTGAIPVKASFENAGPNDALNAVLSAGKFDVLVCCAGVNIGREAVADIDMNSLLRTINVNLVSALRLSSVVLPHMTSQRWGRIVFLGSIYADIAAPYNCAYNISKHALTGLCRSIVADYPGTGVTVNQLAVGPVESSLLQRVSEERAARMELSLSEVQSGLIKRIPTRRLGQPDDVSTAVEFLISDGASFINGSSIRIDGGMLAVR